jgi:hypothetical protein
VQVGGLELVTQLEEVRLVLGCQLVELAEAL